MFSAALLQEVLFSLIFSNENRLWIKQTKLINYNITDLIGLESKDVENLTKTKQKSDDSYSFMIME